MILDPGTFRVGDYRTAIPTWVKLQVLLDQFKAGDGRVLMGCYDARNIRFDHRPALETRPYDTEAGDFVPPQNDPEYIEAIPANVHAHRTFGRRPDAEKTVTTRGSDAGEAARSVHIKTAAAIHGAAMAVKRGDYAGAARLLASVPKKRAATSSTLLRHGDNFTKKCPKRKIPSRPFRSKGKRPLRFNPKVGR